MNTTYRVTDTNGHLLGTFAKDELLAVKALVDANPGAKVKPVVSYTACAKHAAFEAGNCPSCGTSRMSF